jgi:hypothetical protein
MVAVFGFDRQSQEFAASRFLQITERKPQRTAKVITSGFGQNPEFGSRLGH